MSRRLSSLKAVHTPRNQGQTTFSRTTVEPGSFTSVCEPNPARRRVQLFAGAGGRGRGGHRPRRGERGGVDRRRARAFPRPVRGAAPVAHDAGRGAERGLSGWARDGRAARGDPADGSFARPAGGRARPGQRGARRARVPHGLRLRGAAPEARPARCPGCLYLELAGEPGDGGGEGRAARPDGGTEDSFVLRFQGGGYGGCGPVGLIEQLRPRTRDVFDAARNPILEVVPLMTLRVGIK